MKKALVCSAGGFPSTSSGQAPSTGPSTMLRTGSGHRVAVVVLAYEKLIGPGMSSILGMSSIPVIETMPEYIDHIVMVDDTSKDDTIRALNRVPTQDERMGGRG